MTEDTQTKPDPPPTFTPDQADQLLGVLVSLAMNHPDNPAIMLATIKSQHIVLVRQAIMRAMPFPWHNAIQSLLGTQSDDETRLTACLFAVVFVQGAGMRRAMGA